MLHRVGVISDTHIPHFARIPDAVWRHFEGVELIIHAGDLSILSVIAQLETLAPVVAVQGNVEREEVVLKLPLKREVTVGDCRIGVVHILGNSRAYAQTARGARTADGLAPHLLSFRMHHSQETLLQVAVSEKTSDGLFLLTEAIYSSNL